MDEAGQITLPASLGPLLKAKAFTLVGDHYQLPPLVQSKAAASAGLVDSLFRSLCSTFPQARFCCISHVFLPNLYSCLVCLSEYKTTFNPGL